MTALHNVARSLVSMVRSSGIRKDYAIDEDHGGAEPASRDEWAAQPFGLRPLRSMRGDIVGVCLHAPGPVTHARGVSQRLEEGVSASS